MSGRLSFAELYGGVKGRRKRGSRECNYYKLKDTIIPQLLNESKFNELAGVMIRCHMVVKNEDGLFYPFSSIDIDYDSIEYKNGCITIKE